MFILCTSNTILILLLDVMISFLLASPLLFYITLFISYQYNFPWRTLLICIISWAFRLYGLQIWFLSLGPNFFVTFLLSSASPNTSPFAQPFHLRPNCHLLIGIIIWSNWELKYGWSIGDVNFTFNFNNPFSLQVYKVNYGLASIGCSPHEK